MMSRLFLTFAAVLFLSVRFASSLHVMVNGMPGPMAVASAESCVDRGFELVPLGFTGSSGRTPELLVRDKHLVKLVKGPGFADDAVAQLVRLKKQHPNLVIVDYTHPSATLNNLACYVQAEVDFVMGTTGGDFAAMKEIFEVQGKDKKVIGVIAPNMAKQIVAVQAALLEMSRRFPKSFESYTLTVTESHQATKADTSGTAKAIVTHLTTLNGAADTFGNEQIVMLRNDQDSIKFGVPKEALLGHAFHTYRLTSPDKSVSFELQHNVCGRRVYAEGTADAVQFVAQMRAEAEKKPKEKRLFNMIDVLEYGGMQ